MVNAALDGSLAEVETVVDPFFQLAIPVSCPNVPDEVLDPRNTWEDKEAYDKKANTLARQFNENFEKFKEYASDEIMAGAPKVMENS